MPIKTVLVRLKGDSSDLTRALLGAAAASKTLGKELDDAEGSSKKLSDSLETSNDRTTMLIQSALALGPALVPLGAQAVPVIAGLTTQLTIAAGAAGVTVLAFQGIGDSLKAVNEYQIEPTTANLEKMQEEMDKLGPAGRDFVLFLQDLRPELQRLQDVAQEGMLPGAAEGLESLMTQLPEVEIVVGNIAAAMGDLLAQAGGELAGPDFEAFFTYMETEAGPILTEFSQTIGNFFKTFTNLIVAFGPMTDDFSGNFLQMSRDIEQWSAALADSKGFAEFASYIEQTGPAVWETLGALANALLALVEAAAPVGRVALPIIEAIADVLAIVARSPVGPVLIGAAAGLSAISRAVALYKIAQGSAILDLLGGAGKDGGKAGASMRAIAAGGVAMTAALIGAAEAVERLNGGFNTATLDRDFEALATGDVTENMDNLVASLETMRTAGSVPWLADLAGEVVTLGGALGNTNVDQAADDIKLLDERLASLVESGNADQAATEFDALVQGLAEVNHTSPEAVIDDVTEMMGQYGTALENATGATVDLAAGQQELATASGLTKSEITGLNAAMEEQVSIASQAFDAVTQYGEALDAATAQGKKSNAGIDASTKAGRANREALAGLRDAWNAQGDAIAQNVGKWQEARRQYVQAAVDMGVTKKRARELAQELLEIPTKRQIQIELRGGQEAIDAIKRIERQVRSVPTEWRTRFYVTQVNAYNKRAAMPELERATGGPIVGPGTKTSDSVPVMASRGEFMMSAATVDHYGLDAMFAMNARMLASGGDVTGRTPQGIGGALAREAINAARALGKLADQGEDDVEREQRNADREQKTHEQQQQHAKERLEEEKAVLKELRDARKQFAEEVANQFRTGLFGDVDLAELLRQGEAPGGLSEAVSAWMQEQAAADPDFEVTGRISDYVDDFLATLTDQQRQVWEAQAQSGVLRANTSDAETFERVLERLHRMGLRGGAFNELAISGNVAQAQTLVQMGPDFVRTLVRDYRDRNEALRNLGASVGNARFGADIRDQLQVVRRLTDHAKDTADSVESMEKSQRVMAARLDAIERTGPERTGRAVSVSINGAVTAGQRRG